MKYRFATYNKGSKPTVVINLDTGMFIPLDTPSSHLNDYLKYVEEGGSTEPPYNPLEDLEAVRKSKFNEISKLSQDFINTYSGIIGEDSTTLTPEFEVKTWSLQAEEAKAYFLDNTLATPRIDLIYLERGLNDKIISKHNFRLKVYYKAEAYEHLLFNIVGQRQKYEDVLLSCTTVQEINNFSIQFTYEG